MAAPFDTRKVKEMEQAVLRLRDQVAELTTQSKQIPTDIRTHEDALAASHAKIIVLQKEAVSLKAQQKAAQEEKVHHTQTVTQATKEAPHTIQALKKELDDIKKQRLVLQETLKGLEQKEQSTTQALRAKEEEVARTAKEHPAQTRVLQDKVATIIKDVTTREQEIKKLQEEQTSHERERERLKAEHTKTERLLRDATRKYADVQKELAYFQKQLDEQARKAA